MRARTLAYLLFGIALTDLTGCAPAPIRSSQAPAVPAFTVTRLRPVGRPSPLGLQVTVGRVRALIPDSWEAAPLPQARYPREGYVAAPHLREWERGEGTVLGSEAFWIDVGNIRIPSPYYYLVARGPALADLASSRSCHPVTHRVFLDRRPDLTGETFSPGDYVASGSGICLTRGDRVRWEYIVVAPGYGPIHQIGIPTSGLYVVIAAASGPGSKDLLRQIIQGTRFSNTSISQFIDVARTVS